MANFLDPFAAASSPEAKLARQVATLEQQARDVGAPSELAEPRESAFGKFLNFLSIPNQAVLGLLDSAFIRGDIGSPGVGLGIQRGLEERTNAFDLLRRETDLGPVSRGVLGFGLSMATDPLSYITGSGSAARSLWGGMPLTKSGMGVADDAVRKLMAADPALDLLTAQEKVADGFKGMSEFTKYASKIKGEAKKLGIQPENSALLQDVLAGVRDGDKTKTWLDSMMAAGLGGADEAEDLAKEYFKEPGVYIGANIPFLGHFTGKGYRSPGAKGVRGRVFSAISDAVNFDKVGTDITLPEPAREVLEGMAAIARTGASKIRSGLSMIPGVGGAIDASEKAVKALNNVLTHTFQFNKLTGAADDLSEDYVNGLALIDAEAARKTREVLSPGFLPDGTKNTDLLKKVTIHTDALGFKPTLGEAAKEMEGTPHGKALLRYINKNLLSAKTVDDLSLHVVDEADAPLVSEALRYINDKWKANFNKYLADSSIDPQVRDSVGRLQKAFKELFDAETADGVVMREWEHYMPRVLSTLGKGGQFTKSRSFRSLGEAFADSGLVANLDAAELFQQRYAASLRLRGGQKYFQRATLMNSMAPETYAALVRANALGGPEGELAAAILKKERLPLPQMQPEGAAQYGELLKREGGVANPASTSVYTGKLGAELKGVDGDAAKSLVAEAAIGGREALNDLLVSRGYEGLGEVLPRGIGGETARVLEEKVGGLTRKVILPTPVYEAIEATKAQRDMVKELVKSNQWAAPALKLYDTATSWLKKGTLYPWPSYWFNQAFGNTLMDLGKSGIDAAGPGAMADFANLLHGGIVKDKFGNVISLDMLQEALRRYGGVFGGNDFADIANAAADTNISKYLGHTGSVISSLKRGEKLAALKNAQTHLADKFENYFRARKALFYMKEGGAAADAVRTAQRDLINYRNMSPIERSVFRRLFFFYGWTKGATAQNLTNMFLNPGALATQLRAARATSEFFSGQNPPPSLDEFDAEQLDSLIEAEQIAFPLGKTKGGKDTIARFNNLPLNTILSQFSLSMPRNLSMGEIVNTFSDDAARNIQKAAASANPLIKVLAERMSGKNLYFNKPLDSEFLRKLPSAVSIAEKIAPYQFTKVPAGLIDEFWQKFLGAVPDGKGNLVTEPSAFYALTTVIPPLARAIALGRAFSDSDLNLAQGAAKAVTTVGLSHGDLDNTRLYGKREALQQLLNQPIYKTRLEQMREGQ